MPKNETRVAADHGMLVSQARLNRVIKVDCAANKHSWNLSDEEWNTHSEFESIFKIVSVASTQAQYERLFMGPYTPMVKTFVMKRLRDDEIAVINYDKMTDKPRFERNLKKVEDFTELGKEALTRTRLEGERRFCCNRSEVIDGASPVEFTDGELVATLLDIRTVHCRHLTKAQRIRAKTLYVEEYLKFYRRAERFEKEMKEIETAAAAADAEDQVCVDEPQDVADKDVNIPVTKPTQAREDTFLCAPVANTWSDDELDENDAVVADEDPEEVPTLTDEDIREIAENRLKNFRTVTVDWRSEFPEAELPPPPATLDIFKHIMLINPGKVYQRLEKEDPGREKYGFIPLMAAGCKGCIGFLPASSFCERVNSIAKDVMTDAHTLMDKESLEKLVVLRINRGFMEYMRSKYNHLTKQQFGQTLVELVKKNAKGRSFEV